MKMVQDTRKYIKKENGVISFMTVNYRVFLDGKTVTDVKNEFGYFIEKNSECFDYFTAKYAKNV